MPKFETETTLFGHFWRRIVEKALAIFEFSTPKFVHLHNFMKKTKTPKFATQNE